jgi:tetratricopeptide (TPR) repeat protein
MEDGSAPDAPVGIESLCGSQLYTVATADGSGFFSFRLGGPGNRPLQDASAGSSDGSFNRPASSLGNPPVVQQQTSTSDSQQPATTDSQPQTGLPTAPNRPGFNDRQIRTCDIRARLAGYRSDVVSFANRKPADNPYLGTLFLHPVTRPEAMVVSVAALAVPKDARRAYEAGLAALKRKRPADARADFEKATRIYPQYAAAWCALGSLHAQQGRVQEARQSFETAIQADSKYLDSYVRLSALLAVQRLWRPLAETASRLLKLDPNHHPQGYYFNALVNYNTGSLAAAEENAREAERLDERRQFPDTWRLLGSICAARGKYADAASQLGLYLKMAPKAPEAAAVRAQLAQVERRAAQAAALAQAPPK